MNFFYDEQIRRFLVQFIRIFSDIKTQSAPDENGHSVQRRVPVKYGDMSRMVGHIINNQSENTMMSIPQMSVTISSLALADKRRQDTMFEGTKHAIEREFDKGTGTYGDTTGNRYSVKRYMPVPYDLELKLDILTSTTTDKLQLMEQILTIFNPSIQLQHIDNQLDWTSVFEVTLKNVNWSNRSIPVGTNSDFDVATLTFTLPIWLSIASKVKRQRIIEKIITNIHSVPEIDFDNNDSFGIPNSGQIIVTPGNLKIRVSDDGTGGSIVTLLNEYGIEREDLTWSNLISVFGNLDPEITQLRLQTGDDIEDFSGDVYGSIDYHPTISNQLTFIIDTDTLPANNISPVDNIINPTIKSPSNGLPTEAIGQRYIIINTNTNGEEPAIINNNNWGNLVAHNDDIIEYDGSEWFVAFASNDQTGTSHLMNVTDSQQYKFTNEGWVYSYLGEYNNGFWSIENLNK